MCLHSAKREAELGHFRLWISILNAGRPWWALFSQSLLRAPASVLIKDTWQDADTALESPPTLLNMIIGNRDLLADSDASTPWLYSFIDTFLIKEKSFLITREGRPIMFKAEGEVSQNHYILFIVCSFLSLHYIFCFPFSLLLLVFIDLSVLLSKGTDWEIIWFKMAP